MTQEQYERILRAALNMKRSKFAMAEALVLDIPKAPNGANDGSVTAALEEVSEQIVDMGGDDIAVATLAGMRKTGMWVNAARTPGGPSFPWREGSSFTAHRRAYEGGMEWSEFAKLPRTTRAVQQMLGQKASSNDVKHTVENMTQVEKIDMMRELASDDIDSVTSVIVEKQKENVTEAVKKTTTPTHKNPSDSLGLTNQLHGLREVIAGNVRFTELITGGWTRQLEELGGFVKDDQRQLIEADVNKAIAVYEGFLEGLNG